MSNEEMPSVFMNVLMMFISLFEWLKHGNCMHMMAWPFSLVGGQPRLGSLRWWNKRLLLLDSEMYSTIITELNRPRMEKCCQELQLKWCQKNAWVWDTKPEDYPVSIPSAIGLLIWKAEDRILTCSMIFTAIAFVFWSSSASTFFPW